MTLSRFICRLLPPPALALAATSACTQSAVRLPAGWRVTPAVKNIDSAARTCANGSMREWNVALSPDSSALFISAAKSEVLSHEMRVPGGRLVGVDMGEFGGDLSWVPDTGARTRIVEDNIRALLSSRSGIYALAGLAHLYMNSGSVYRVARDSSGAWTAHRLVDLSGAPAAATVTRDDSMLVVTTRALELVHPGGVHRVLHRNEMWSFVHPTSVVRGRAGVIYVGMRSAVARLTPRADGFREDWLSPPGGCRGGNPPE